jgi:hypothetical protein
MPRGYSNTVPLPAAVTSTANDAPTAALKQVSKKAESEPFPSSPARGSLVPSPSLLSVALSEFKFPSLLDAGVTVGSSI